MSRAAERTALVFGARKVGFSEFDARVDDLAHRLLAAGVGPETAVAVAMPRSVEMLVALHAVVTAGGQYVPFDTAVPADRARYMVETSDVQLALVSTPPARSLFEGLGDIEILDVDCSGDTPAAAPVTDADRVRPIHRDDAAYTLFTSGSTGRPKGVTVSHGAIVNRLEWLRRRCDFGPSDVFLLKTPYTFDVSIGELFSPMGFGATLVIAEADRHADPEYLAEIVSTEQVTVIHFVPSMLSAFLDYLGPRVAHLASIRIMLASGEGLPPATANSALEALPHIELHNLYGPTEAAVEVSDYRVMPKDTAVPIGGPAPNNALMVLDALLAPVPRGVPGELYLGGVQLARGYASAPGLTAERFVADPFGPAGARLYRTGDLVRWNHAGEVEYLGRTDFQVKLRGQRIELGEIESVLTAVPGVVHAAATVAVGPGGGEHLVAYVSPSTVAVDDVKSAVADALPTYMRPTVWTLLDDVVLNSAGKLDRKALPAPEFGAVEAEFVAPEGEAEETVAEVFATVLGLERVSVTESFFDLGGNSLSAMRLAARAGDALGVELSVRDLFDAPTVRDLIAVSVGKTAALAPVVAIDPRPDRIPLSFAQNRMWFLNRLDATSATYNIPMAIRLTGDVDVDELVGSIRDALVRHEVLRTVYPAVDGEPAQFVVPADEALARFDWAETESLEELVAATTTGFDVTSELPIRGRIRRGGDGSLELALVVHHIAFDGESTPVLLRDVLAAYAHRVDSAVPALAPLSVQYADFAIWEHAELGAVDDHSTPLGRQMAYWRDKLRALPAVTDLPMDRPRPAVFDTEGGLVTVAVDDELADRIADLGRAYEITPFMITYAALAVTVSRLASTSDTVVASPTAGRTNAAIDDLVGMFVNTLVLRADTTPARSVDAVLRAVRADVLDAFANAQVQFDDLLEVLAPPHTTSYSPLAQIAFTYTAEPTRVDQPVAVAGLQAEPIVVDGQETKFDLMVLAHGRTEQSPLSMDFLYSKALYDERTVQRFATAYLRILDALTGDSSRAIGDIDIVGAASAAPVAAPRERIAGLGGAVGEGTLLDVLARRDLDPYHPALICNGTELSYDEFEARTNQVARALLGRGVQPDDVVAVGLERSIESVVAIWGVIKSGAAYLSIDPAYPAERIEYMLTDSAVDFGITDADIRGRLGAGGCEWIELGALSAEAESDAPIADAERNGSVRLENLAYLIYTSGSTGRPKGVAVSNTGIADLVDGYQKVTGARDDDPDTRILHVASPSFDASFFEMAWAITAGHALVIAPHADYAGDVLDLVLERDEVTDMVITPSVLATLDPDRGEFVRNLATAGEACPPELVERWSARGRRLFNFYGPSETTVWATRARMMPRKPVTIGRAIGGFAARILDPRLHEVPQGVVGELYLSAAGLARGYLHRPGNTAASFVADPFVGDGSRLYATGDMVKLNGSGDLEFAGRADHQVKINGQRVELGEIESVFADQPGVAQALVVGRETEQGGRTHTMLIAYLVAKPGESVDPVAAKTDAADRLAAHMLPTQVLVIDEIPRTPAGKLDRDALPKPEYERAEYIAPESDAETAVAQIFADVLGRERFSVAESFFDAGGNSLSAMRVVTRAGVVLDAELTVRDLFESPTVRQLVASAADAGTALAPLTAITPRPERIPLSFAQVRIWFLNQFDSATSAYNIPAVLRLTGALDVNALHAAVADVVARHEVLRTTFPSVDGGPVQSIAPTEDIARLLDWRQVDSQQEIEAAVAAGFDVTAQWPMRVRLWPVSADEHLFAVVVHHIAADGESLRPLVTDLITAYAARAAGTAPDFVPLEVQVADFAIWQERVLGSPKVPQSVVGEELAYWRRELADLPDVLELPADRLRPTVASQQGDSVAFVVPAEVGMGVAELARKYGASPFMVVHAVLSVLLARLSGTEDIVIGVPVAGRGHAALDRVVGMFVNTLVLRAEVDPSMSFETLLTEVRDTDLDAFAHADAPFEAVVDVVDPIRSEAFAPLTQVWLSVNQSSGDTADTAVYDDGRVRVEGLDLAAPRANVDLLMTLDATGDGSAWNGSLVFATDLFDPRTAQSMADRFVVLLSEICAEPTSVVGDLAWLSGDERAQLIGWSKPATLTEPPTLADDDLAEMVTRAGQRFGDAPAVVFGDWTLTHAELSARVNTLARELIADGVGPGSTVAVCAPQSIEQVLAVHAVVATGASYVPIAPSTPTDRAEYMLSIADARYLLVTPDFGESDAVLAARARQVLVRIVDARTAGVSSPQPLTALDRLAPVRAENAAYTIFTSGSTGRPKGVTAPHRAVMAHLAFDQEVYGFGPSDVYLQMLSFTFDPSVLELFRWVASGGRLIIPGDDGQIDTAVLHRLIQEHRVTTMIVVPSVLSVLVDAYRDFDNSWVSSLRVVSVGGEALVPALLDHVVEEWPNATFHNQYGPTEATIYATYARLRGGRDVVPIGAPLTCATGYVLDRRMRAVPIGVPGELYLGGDLVGTGYAGRADLTAERFIADPFGPAGTRLYRTGDLAAWNAAGELEYLGRTDFQVKMRGQRIELGEIEAVLSGVPGVVHAAATVVESPGGGQHLAAYLAPQTVDLDAVKSATRHSLPAYMVPTIWKVVDELALTTAGKIDRKALPELDFASLEAEYVAPDTAAESQLAAIVEGLLGMERVSVTAPFFSLGGDSIMSIQLASGARAVGLDLSPRQIFEHQTIRAMAALTASAAAGSPMLDEPGDGAIALSSVGAWMIDAARTAADYADFNQSAVLQAPNEATTELVGQVLSAVVEAHPLLSARLLADGAGTRLVPGVAFDAETAVAATEVNGSVDSVAFTEALTAAHAAAAARLDPETGSQLQAVLVTGSDGARLVVVIHHLAVDAVSWPILFEDLVTVWAQLQRGHRVTVRPEATSVAAWTAGMAERSDEHADELDYWLARSPERPTDLGAEFDAARDRFSTARSVSHTVDPTVTRAVLTTVPDAFGGNVGDVLLAAFARAVRSWQLDRGIVDDAPVTVLTEGHGRYEELVESGPDPRRADLSRTVGWFTMISPMSIDPTGDPIHAVKAAKEERLGRPRHGAGFGVLRYSGHLDLDARPLPSIAFNYLGAGAAAGDAVPGGAGMAFAPVAHQASTPPTISGGLAVTAPLMVNATAVSGTNGPELRADLTFAGEILAAADIRDLAARWSVELAAIVDAVADSDPGLSPSDVPGTSVTQADLDELAGAFPGADLWPLTPLQQGLYFQSTMTAAAESAVDVYLTQATLGLAGDTDAERLRRAAGQLLEHHRVLRSGYVRTGSGALVAVVADSVEVPWREVTLRSGADVTAEVAAIALAERLAGFDLAAPPLLRLVLVRHAEGASLVVTNHHILFDGWSGPLVLADLLALYATGAPYTGTGGTDFGDYVRRVAGTDHAAGRDAWRAIIEPLSEPTLVAPGVQATQESLPADLRVSVPSDVVAGVDRLTKDLGVTTSTVVQFAWAVLLSRLTGNQVVAFGETVSGRPADLPGIEKAVGLFINTLPAVVDVDPAKSAAQVLTELQARKVSVFDHQHLGLPELTALTGHAVLFDTLTVFESFPVDADSLADAEASAAAEAVGGLQVNSLQAVDSTHYPLNLATSPSAAGLLMTLKYLPDAFSSDQVAAFGEALTSILASVAADAERAVGDISLLSDNGAAALMAVSGGPGQAPATLQAMFTAAARRAPDRRAVIDGTGAALTYRELDEDSDRLAAWLRDHGVGVESMVAVAMPRSVELLVAVWAVAKAGGAYVPVDPEYPADRIATMIADAGITLGLTVADAAANLPADVRWTVLDADDTARQVAAAVPLTAPVSVHPDSLAYVIYTSGSTGRPKGVAVPHRGLADFGGAAAAALRAADGASVLGFASPSFDASMLELLLATMNAGTLVYRPADVVGGSDLARYIRDRGVSHVFLTPAVLATLDPDSIGDVVGLGAGGESVPQALVDAWAPHVPITNMYGPSETTVAVTMSAPLAIGDRVRLGGPIPGTRLAVLDARLNPVPIGMPGELYVSGASLARGYLGRPSLIADHFVADPAGDGGRMYRTGDVVRWHRTDDGGLELEYSGRSDDQVKLRGLRIELGEIEAVLDACPGVSSAVVIGVGGSVASSLAAYVVADAVLDVAALREFAGDRLPSYMVPSTITVLEEMPLTPIGKVDKRALPGPVVAAVEYVAPAGESETAVAAAFAEILGVDRVSATESFFDAGGNSLSAMRLAARVSAILDAQLSARDLFAAPTVSELVALAGGKQEALAPIVAVADRPERIPLSFAQQRMWILNQIDASSSAYNIPMALRLRGRVDIDALHAALVAVVTRHEVLRTTYPSADGVPHQKVLRPSAVGARLDWDEADSLEEIQESFATGFDVTKQLPLRVRILESGPDEHVLAATFHHIAFDGESMEPFAADLVTAYLATADDRDPEFAPLEVQFADYAIWQHEVLGAPTDAETVVGRQLDYWRTQLSGLPDVVELPTDRPRPAAASRNGAQFAFEVPEHVTRGLAALGAEAGATPFMAVHAALAVLLARMTAVDDIAVGTPIAGRGQSVLDPLVGMFVNTLILRTPVDGAVGFRELLSLAKDVDLAAYANADVPFESVVEAVGARTSPAFSPLSQVWLTFDQSAVPQISDGAEASPDELTVEPLAQLHVQAKVDLMVGIGYRADGPWSADMLYATDLFDEPTVASFARNLVAILEQAVADPDAPIGDIDLPQFAAASVPESTTVDDKPRAKVIPASSAVRSGGLGADPVLLLELFSRSAQKWAARQAVVDPDGSSLTYAQLDARSNRLARWLIARGIGPESLVALAIGRSVELLTAIWAVAKTGGGYVPIDPTYPADRVAAMVEDSAAVLGLAVSGSGALPDEGFAWLRLDDAAVEAELADCADGTVGPDEVLAPVRIENIAYVIYTSGSTGRPKGVAVSHSGLANFAAEEVRRASADEYSRVLGFASPSFDASVLEYLLATVAGGVLIYRPDDAVGGSVLQDFMMRQAITHTFLTPTVLATLDPAAVPALRVVYAGGEAVAQALKDAWAPFRRIQNLYGPTETTIGVAISEPMQLGAPVYLGGPIAGVGFLVLDARLKPVAPGVPGELYLCGDALSRGYLARPGLTAVRFVANPYGEHGDRMYRTGDVVRWRTDEQGLPTLEYSGRSDDQVKLRGLRIELGEIEAALSEHPAVTSSVVIGIGGSVAADLAGYVVTNTPTDVAALRAFVGERLPTHMVPASLTILDEMPRTPVGKLDKAALPAPVIEAGEYVAPETAAEETVAAHFAQILGVDRVSVTDSFFDLGGNSLSAMRLVARAGEALGVELQIADLFETPSVRRLIASASREGTARVGITAVSPRPDRVPLSFAQARMWFINRLEPESPVYNIPVVLRLSGVLDVAALRAAIVDVVVRHEVLRTSFPDVDGVPFQSIAPAAAVADSLDWEIVGSESAVHSAVVAGFDLSAAWPLRVRVWQVSESEHVLAVVAHHIAADGESMTPLIGDVIAAYAARSVGTEPDLSPLEVQFADFAIWQHEVLGSPADASSVVGEQLAYWRERLAGTPDVLDLPTDRPRPAVASHRGGQVRFELPEGLGGRIAEVAREHEVTSFMVVHAALAVLLARLAATQDVSIATPIAGRGQAVLDPLVGMFVNSLVLRTQVEPDALFGEFLEQVKSVDLEAFAHADAPFETVVEAVDPVRSEAFSPLAQVIIAVMQGAGETSGARIGELLVEPVTEIDLPAQYDLHVNVSLDPGGESWLLYATDLFDHATIERIARRLVGVLEAVTADPMVAVGDVELLDGAEREAVTALSRGVAAPAQHPLIEEIVECADRSPNAVAVVDADAAVTYRGLMARADAVAEELAAEGVGVDDVVVLALPRSVEWIVGMVAAWKIGAAYAPVDPESPTERIGSLVADATATIVIGAPDWVTARRADRALGAARLVAIGEREATEPFAVRGSDASAARLAYVITTSGSTGRPKPTMVQMAGVANTVAWYRREVGLMEGDGVLIASSPTFDLTQKNVWATLASGATVHLAAAAFEPSRILRIVEESSIAVMNMAPSAFEAIADADSTDALAGVRMLFLGGESIKPAILRELMDRGMRIYNSYGPTEASDVVSFREVRADDRGSVPIGRPIPGVDLFVLDARLKTVPSGVAGELYVGGIAVGRGYGAMPGKTAERFVANPFAVDGARMYRTGDLARWNDDGDLEYLGRTDSQIKLRGLRIELGEIEAVLAAVPGVDRAAAAVVEIGDHQHLAAYLAPASVDLGQVKAAASAALPSYMIPGLWTMMDVIALNAAGKIDRQRLPEPDPRSLDVEYVAPATELESAVAGVLEAILGQPQIGVTTSFFDVGGNSLTAVRVISRLHEATGVQLPLSAMFVDPTVRGLAQAIEGGVRSTEVLVPLRPAGTRAPLFCIHPAGGLAWSFGGLAPYLADRPIYGLQDPAVVAGETSPTTIEAFADRYLDEIRRVAPSGPYNLLGWSLGGVIAFEIATRLRAGGEEVAFLGMMDSIAGEAFDAAAVAASDASVTPVTANELMSGLIGGAQADLLPVDRDGDVESLQDLVDQVVGARLGSAEQVRAMIGSFAVSDTALSAYSPGVFDGALLYFTATDGRYETGEYSSFWTKYVTLGVTNIDVATTHHAMGNRDALAAIGSVIETSLRP